MPEKSIWGVWGTMTTTEAWVKKEDFRLHLKEGRVGEDLISLERCFYQIQSDNWKWQEDDGRRNAE